ncbi:MAG: hypothetical protein OER87_14855, partial [Gammaproteobacteria bacterium]|nr:hypothetical protein [Gammaproteobacteria bacterium]
TVSILPGRLDWWSKIIAIYSCNEKRNISSNTWRVKSISQGFLRSWEFSDNIKYIFIKQIVKSFSLESDYADINQFNTGVLSGSYPASRFAGLAIYR